MKICSDFDSDCNDVHDHFRCWLGTPLTEIDGQIFEIAVADGICPFCESMMEKSQKRHESAKEKIIS